MYNMTKIMYIMAKIMYIMVKMMYNTAKYDIITAKKDVKHQVLNVIPDIKRTAIVSYTVSPHTHIRLKI